MGRLLRRVYQVCQNLLSIKKLSGTNFVSCHFTVTKFISEKLKSATVDMGMKDKLSDCLVHDVVAFRINSFAFVLRDKPSSTNPLPWIHVYITGKKLTCSNRYLKWVSLKFFDD